MIIWEEEVELGFWWKFWVFLVGVLVVFMLGLIF
jgi:hypothetical protein